jgi:glycosyltransferase involved in cell wall biosynthesis
LILNYEYPPVGGGAGVATAALAAGLAASGAEVHVLTTDPGPGVAIPADRVPGLTVHRVHCRRTALHEASMRDAASFLVAALPAARRLVKRVRPDVAHLFFSLPTGLLLPLFRAHRVPTVVSLRGSDVPGYDPFNSGLQRAHRLLRPITRSIWRGADEVVAVCHSLRHLAAETDPTLHCSVIPNGVDVELFRPDTRGRHSGGPVRCVTVARLVERKGIDDLVHALARLERGRYHLEIIGSGPAEPALRELVARLGLRAEVRFMGALDRAGVAARLRAADLFTLPSRAEAFGNVFAEAMAAGLPVVGTAIGGITELVQDGRHGLLVPPRDPAALAAAISLLGEQPALRSAMGARNRAHAVTHLSWEAVTQRYLAVYATARQVPPSMPTVTPLAVVR